MNSYGYVKGLKKLQVGNAINARVKKRKGFKWDLTTLKYIEKMYIKESTAKYRLQTIARLRSAFTEYENKKDIPSDESKLWDIVISSEKLIKTYILISYQLLGRSVSGLNDFSDYDEIYSNLRLTLFYNLKSRKYESISHTLRSLKYNARTEVKNSYTRKGLNASFESISDLESARLEKLEFYLLSKDINSAIEVEREAKKKEVYERVLSKTHKLSKGQLDIIRYILGDELSPAEISRICNVSKASISIQLSRIRGKLA